MLKIFGKILCLIFGHDEWDGTAAITIGHVKMQGVVNIEFCTRCQTLWGNYKKPLVTLQAADVQKAIDSIIGQIKNNPPPILEQEFVYDEDQIVKVRVDYKSADALEKQNHIEVECANGKIVAYTLDFEEKPSYNADDDELIRDQIGNVLSKIDNPVKIFVRKSIYDLFDFQFNQKNNLNSLKKALQAGNYNAAPGTGYGVQGIASGGIVATGSSGINSQGAISGQGITGSGVSGSGSGH